MKVAYILLFSLVSLSAFALETDNYLTWDRTLPDSREAVNDFMASKINDALKSANLRATPYSCREITFRIAKEFQTTPTSKSLENFVEEELSKSNIYPAKGKFLEMSILNNTRFYLKYSGLSPNLQINGYYFGADKLSHFASTGRRYLRRYLKQKKKGASEEAAVKAAIRYGLLNEKSVLGWWASGVFSYGDMEANYQGLRYYLRMCMSGENQYLAQDENGNWSLVLKPDLGEYVSGFWDESFNPSFFSASSWQVVKEAIADHYCPLRDTPIVQERMAYYHKQEHTSFSLRYIQELQERGRIPLPMKYQSVDELCQKNSTSEEIATAE